MKSSAVEECEGGVLIRVLVKAGARRLRCPAGLQEGFVVVEVCSPPVGGRANRELVKAFAKFLGVSSGSVSIVRGLKDKEKVIRVLGVSVESVRGKLGT
ncbi:MAG: DUF167 family protein [Candidatus Jordarchaeaceae archaeon]